MKQEDYLLIDKYLDQKLTKAETQAFEHRIKKDKRLAKELAMAKSRNRFLQNRADIHLIKGYTQEIAKTYLPQPVPAVSNPTPIISFYKRRSFIKSAVAASLGLLITAIPIRKFLSKSPYEEVAEHRFLSGELGGEAALNLNQFFKAFNTKNYKTALKGFEELSVQQIEANPEINLAKGICYLELNKYKEAADIFTHLMQSQATYRNEGNWYLALTALKQNDVVTCRQFLSKINPSSSYYQRVEDLLLLIDKG